MQAGTQCFRTDTDGAFAWFAGGEHNDAQFNPDAGGTRPMRMTGANAQRP